MLRCIQSLELQKLHQQQEQIHSLNIENNELKLLILRWRKKVAVLRLKLSSSEETAAFLRGDHAASRQAICELVESNAVLSLEIENGCKAAQKLRVRLMI